MCSDNFLTGRPSDVSTHPDYAPSLKLGHSLISGKPSSSSSTHSSDNQRLAAERDAERQLRREVRDIAAAERQQLFDDGQAELSRKRKHVEFDHWYCKDSNAPEP